jgi:hypothetical protein
MLARLLVLYEKDWGSFIAAASLARTTVATNGARERSRLTNTKSFGTKSEEMEGTVQVYKADGW